jgi:hypothetical protein
VFLVAGHSHLTCHFIWSYRIPNGTPGPSANWPDPKRTDGFFVSSVVPNWQPRHGPMASFSSRAGTTTRLAHRVGVGLSGSAGPFPALLCRQGAAAGD